ncbi:MAG: hypothetical protein GY757_13310, partial [bacterium]|nr:hypothetical protein [bacterium]
MNHLCKQICLTALLMAISLPSLFGEDFFRIKEEITAEAWLKKSIFYISPTLNINNIGYNSNVYSYEYLDTPDWNADAGLTLDLAVLLKDRFIFQITETPSYTFYDENESERAFNNEFRFNAYTWLGKFNLEYQFEKLYLRQRSSLESGWRIRRWETSHRVSLDYGRRNRFYFNLYVQKRDLTYGDELLLDTFNMNRMFNRTEYLLGISANKNIFSRSTLAFQFEYFDDRFL